MSDKDPKAAKADKDSKDAPRPCLFLRLCADNGIEPDSVTSYSNAGGKVVIVYGYPPKTLALDHAQLQYAAILKRLAGMDVKPEDIASIGHSPTLIEVWIKGRPTAIGIRPEEIA